MNKYDEEKLEGLPGYTIAEILNTLADTANLLKDIAEYHVPSLHPDFEIAMEQVDEALKLLEQFKK